MGNKSVENPPVEEGQVWRDNDPRQAGRLVRIDSISNGYVRVIGVQSGVKTRITKSRFSRSSAHRGYSLVAEPAAEAPVAPPPATEATQA